MFRTLILVLFYSFFSICAEARFSQFLHITPDTQDQYGVSVSLTQVKKGRIYKIKFQTFHSESKLAWLVLSEKPLTPKGQNLRNFLWDGSRAEAEILIKSKILPTVSGRSLSKNAKDSKYYELEVSAKLVNRTYIYIDFPLKISDGGYYYSVDLGAYLNGQKVNAD